MRYLIAPLASIGVLAAMGMACAAPPAYCALYAREYANQFAAAAGEQPGSEQRIQDEAYYRCLNQDEEPELPETSAYYGTALDTGGQGGPLEPLPENTSADSKGGATSPAAKVQEASNAPAQRYFGSGKQPWTPEWRAWCKEHFPNSFDEKTGTILPYGGERQFCK